MVQSSKSRSIFCSRFETLRLIASTLVSVNLVRFNRLSSSLLRYKSCVIARKTKRYYSIAGVLLHASRSVTTRHRVLLHIIRTDKVLLHYRQSVHRVTATPSKCYCNFVIPQKIGQPLCIKGRLIRVTEHVSMTAGLCMLGTECTRSALLTKGKPGSV